MAHHLVCVHDFGPFKRGDMVNHADEVALHLAGPNAHYFVKIAAPPEEAARTVEPANVWLGQ